MSEASAKVSQVNSGLTHEEICRLGKVQPKTLETYCQQFSEFLKPPTDQEQNTFPTQSLKTVLKIRGWYQQGMSRDEIKVLLKAGQHTTDQPLVQGALLRQKCAKSSNVFVKKISLTAFQEFIDSMQERESDLKCKLNRMNSKFDLELVELKDRIAVIDARTPVLLDRLAHIQDRLIETEARVFKLEKNHRDTLYSLGEKNAQLRHMFSLVQELNQRMRHLETRSKQTDWIDRIVHFVRYRIFRQKNHQLEA